MLECRICGHKFELEEADRSHCNCGFNCGGINAPCPNCGFDVLIPKELRKNDSKSVMSRIRSML